MKIRGFRIELGEIEVVISKFQSIQEVLVITHEHDDGEKDLCAYFVASRSIEVVKIKEVISEELPDYMIPRYFVQLDKMPLTLNGKIDHERLPVPEKSLQTNTEYIAPRTPLELELTRIWKEVLSLDKIGVKDNFFILGGHSLKILEALVKSTQAGLNISIKDYYDLKTIEAIASKLSNNEPKLIRKHEHTHHFFVTPPLKLCLNGEIDKPFNSENIMLTGSTGYLGVHILERLLKKTNCKITCILREKSNQSAAERLLETLLFYFKKDAHNITDQFNQRITVLCGDLSKTRFGLEEDVYMRLKSTIDEVIHSAALTKHFGTEEDFRLANVASVEHLLQFVGPDIKFHHVSTVSVSGILVEADEDVLFTEKDFYIKQDYKCNAYIESKFLAEQLIYDYIARGTNAVIYRVGNLTNRYSDGQHQKNIDDNAFLKRIKFMLTYGVMTDLFSADIEFTPVDHCSDAILNIIMQRVDSNKHYVFHLMNDKSLKYTQFLKILSELGYRVELMRHERFEYIMSNHQDDKQLQEQLQYIMAYRTIKDDHYKARVIVDNSFTNQCLEQLKWQWPEINKMYIRQMIQYMIDTEYLHRDERKILSLRK
ncbi:SDR family oxidoreductase [Paenibacillus tyrfis]|uniref:SDR family oxidoreductase n=1 Tax=Paenibacillus tyrfis TaxID=1501230 RepID=UPI00404112D2